MMTQTQLARLPALAALIAAPAAASPLANGEHESETYVGGLVSLGGAEPIDGYTVMASAEGGHQLAGPWWLHAAAGYGPSIDRFGGHDLTASTTICAQAGAELRTCTRHGAAVCLIGGADAGVQYAAYPTSLYPSGDAVTYHDVALVIVPRIGLDAGGEHVRVRLAVGTAVTVARHEDAMQFGPTTGHVEGIDLAAGVAYQW